MQLKLKSKNVLQNFRWEAQKASQSNEVKNNRQPCCEAQVNSNLLPCNKKQQLQRKQIQQQQQKQQKQHST